MTQFAQRNLRGKIHFNYSPPFFFKEIAHCWSWRPDWLIGRIPNYSRRDFLTSSFSCSTFLLKSSGISTSNSPDGLLSRQLHSNFSKNFVILKSAALLLFCTQWKTFTSYPFWLRNKEIMAKMKETMWRPCLDFPTRNRESWSQEEVKVWFLPGSGVHPCLLSTEDF